MVWRRQPLVPSSSLTLFHAARTCPQSGFLPLGWCQHLLVFCPESVPMMPSNWCCHLKAEGVVTQGHAREQAASILFLPISWVFMVTTMGDWLTPEPPVCLPVCCSGDNSQCLSSKWGLWVSQRRWHKWMCAGQTGDTRMTSLSAATRFLFSLSDGTDNMNAHQGVCSN